MSYGFNLFVEALGAGAKGFKQGAQELRQSMDEANQRDWLEAQRQRELVKQGREDTTYAQQQEEYRAEKPIRDLSRQLDILKVKEQMGELTAPERAQMLDLDRQVKLGGLRQQKEAFDYNSTPEGKALLDSTRKLAALSNQVRTVEATEVLSPEATEARKKARENTLLEAKLTANLFRKHGQSILENKFGVGPAAQKKALRDSYEAASKTLSDAAKLLDKEVDGPERAAIAANMLDLTADYQAAVKAVAESSPAPAVPDPAEKGMNPLDVIRRRQVVEEATGVESKSNAPILPPGKGPRVLPRFSAEEEARKAYARGDIAEYNRLTALAQKNKK